MTYEEILQDALNRVSNSFDKREGSVIYDALAPCCHELALAYADMEKKLANTYAGTAERECLILRAAEIGISPNPATYAIRKGVFTPANIDVLNQTFNFDELNFIATKKISDGVYEMTCQTIGEVGNYSSGTIIPVNYINGLETATLTADVLVYGEEEEDTEVFRARYFETLKNEAIDGNIVQYKKWCNEYSGIGNAKVLPLWNGANTVKVSILNSENGVASNQLVSAFQTYLDPNMKGLGNGQAPIGAIVTVSTATTKTINISATVTLKAGYSAVIGLEDDLREFFKSIAYIKNVVSYISVGSVMLENESVESVSNLRINNGTIDIGLIAEEIAVLGTLAVNVG